METSFPMIKNIKKLSHTYKNTENTIKICVTLWTKIIPSPITKCTKISQKKNSPKALFCNIIFKITSSPVGSTPFYIFQKIKTSNNTQI